MWYSLINFLLVLSICVHSIAALSFSPRVATRSAELKPQDWGRVEMFLWGEAHRKTVIKGRPLSKRWDREAIGTPEVRQLLAAIEFPLHPSEVRIFDGSFRGYEELLSSVQEHGSLRLADNYELLPYPERLQEATKHSVLVAHLLAGRSAGVSVMGEISLLSNADPLLDHTVSQYLQTPGVINLSKKTATIDVDRLGVVGEKTLFVASAGNIFPSKSNTALLASRTLARDGSMKIMPIGAIGPDGLVVKSSVADHSLVVTAPGADLFSFDGKKEVMFNGTSAAAPIVSGVLADVRSILPQLTRDNAAWLLEKTAIKTVTNDVSELNGAGVVNHYKMVKVALRLATEGYDGELMPASLDAYLDFREEVADLLTAAENSIVAAEFLCNLRRAFFLNPDDRSVRAYLGTAYGRMQLSEQAAFYGVPSLEDSSDLVKRKLEERADLVTKKIQLPPTAKRFFYKSIERDIELASDGVPSRETKIIRWLYIAENDEEFNIIKARAISKTALSRLADTIMKKNMSLIKEIMRSAVAVTILAPHSCSQDTPERRYE